MRVAYLAVAVLGLAAAPATAKTVKVTNNGDTGTGSFREAVVNASGDPSITKIMFNGGIGQIDLVGSPVTYSGPQSLSIDGKGAVIHGDGDGVMPGTFNLFESTEGADLSIKRLTFQNGLKGIVVDVPGDAEGEVSVWLSDVTVVGNDLYGLHIDDGGGSNASVGLSISSSLFTSNGQGLTLSDPLPSDLPLDGARVDEAGEGDVMASVHNSVFTETGADGLELNEIGPGDITLIAHGSTFDGNGLVDNDDGVDIDEEDEGSVWFRIVQSTFNGNSDDGIDMDEAGDGDMHASLVAVEVSDNDDKGVNVAENDLGSLDAKVNLVVIEANGFVSSGTDAGLRLQEFGEGDFSARVVKSTIAGNELDIEAAQETPGAGVLRLQAVTYDSIDVDPLEIDVIEVP